jgi:phosphatidylglycerol---prolipoprotein diacylglyceryl transferase
MQQVLFRIGGPDGIPVNGYGFMLLLAFVSCIWLASRRARKVGVDPKLIQDLAVWIFFFGLLGARTTYLLFHEKEHNLIQFLIRLPQIWDGGIIFYGSVIGGTLGYALAYYFQLRHRGISTWQMADILAPTIALGLMLGRVGCLLNGCCYGQVACPDCPAVHFPVSAPARADLVRAGYQTAAGFVLEADGRTRVRAVEPDSPAAAAGLQAGDEITAANGEAVKYKGDLDLLFADWRRGEKDLALTVRRADGKEEGLPAFRPRTLGLHPTQLYESVSMALLLFLLLSFDPFKRRDGQVMALLMMAYAAHRYANEMLRADQRPVLFEVGVSVLLFVAGLGMMLYLATRPGPAPAAPEEPGRPGEQETPAPAVTSRGTRG